jgi:hypothetical protein
MTNDRNYLRMLSDSGLIDAGRAGDNELALVLAERLSALLDVQDRLETVTIRASGRIRRPARYRKQQAIAAMDELDALRGVK